jgi:hypothetical protein
LWTTQTSIRVTFFGLPSWRQTNLYSCIKTQSMVMVCLPTDNGWMCSAPTDGACSPPMPARHRHGAQLTDNSRWKQMENGAAFLSPLSTHHRYRPSLATTFCISREGAAASHGTSVPLTGSSSYEVENGDCKKWMWIIESQSSHLSYN